MIKFSYTGYNSNKQKVKNVIESSSKEEALKNLHLNGIFVTDISELNKNEISFKKKIHPKILSDISKDLSMYLSSQIPLTNAVSLLKKRYENNYRVFSFLEHIYSSLKDGSSFYNSFKQDIYEIPTFYLETIKISEQENFLDKTLLDLSIYLDNKEEIKSNIKSSLSYPIFIVSVAIVMISFMLTFVVPNIVEMFSNNKQELPGITQLVISLGDFMSNNYLYLITWFLSFGGLFYYLLKTNDKFVNAVDKTLLKIPLINKIISNNELAQFSYITSILLNTGIPVAQSFNLASNTLKNSVFVSVFKNAANKISEGEHISNVLANNKQFKLDDIFIQSIAVGEETGQLQPILYNLHKNFLVENNKKINSFVKFLEPLTMLFVGTFIALIVLAIMLPIFSISIS